MGVFSKSLAFFWISLCIQIAQPMKQDELSVKIKELHTSLNKLKTKLDALNKGLTTVKNRLLGIEEESGENLKIELSVALNKIIAAVDAVAVPIGDDLINRNNLVNGAYAAAKDLFLEANEAVTAEEKNAAYDELEKIKHTILNKYKDFVNIGDANKDFLEQVGYSATLDISLLKGKMGKEIQLTKSDYEDVKNKFLTKDSTNFKESINGHNSIQIVVDFMKRVIDEKIVSPNDVLNDCLSSMQYRTQTLILFYILLSNNFYDDADFLRIVMNSMLGYIGQPGFDRLGKCVARKIIEKIENMNSSLLEILEKNMLSDKSYGSTIFLLSNIAPDPIPTIKSNNYPDFKYFMMSFSEPGVDVKADILRFILAMKAQVAILQMKEPEPIAEQEPILPQPKQEEEKPIDDEVEKLIEQMNKNIELPPAPKPNKKSGGFPVQKFLEQIRDIIVNDGKINCYDRMKEKNLNFLGYFKTFASDHSSLISGEFKETYKQMQSLFSLLIKSFLTYESAFERLVYKKHELAGFITFCNRVINLKSECFAFFDDPKFDPKVDCLTRKQINDLPLVKSSKKSFIHNDKNYIAMLLDYGDPKKRDAVIQFFNADDRPQMGTFTYYRAAFEVLFGIEEEKK